MLRNKEIQIWLLSLSGISLLLIAVAAFFPTEAMLLVILTAVLLIVPSLLFTSWRYRELAKLSSYLRQISSGDYTLDVRDNQEGELSILKNDIYKVTLMLANQGALLQEDKLKLTNAISDISHQLKTPLTSMMVMADLLSDANLGETRRKEFTHNIQVQLERIEWLVSSLLKLSKIDAGTAVFKKDKIPVRRLMEKALESLLVPIDIKEQSIQLNGEETVSFQGDLKWTTEALLNLLKNSVEHTPAKGEIQISFTENALYTEIIIEDNGTGIPKEDLPYIFQRFYKGKNAGDDSVGIGLAMAYSIITNQSGDIQVENKKDQGTRFRIKFYKQII